MGRLIMKQWIILGNVIINSSEVRLSLVKDGEYYE